MKKILAGFFAVGLSLATMGAASADALVPETNGEFAKYGEHINEYADLYNYAVHETIYDKKYSEKYQKDYNIVSPIYAFESKMYRNGEHVDSYYIYLDQLDWSRLGHAGKPIDGDTYLIVNDNNKRKYIKVVNPNPSEEIKEEPKKKFKFKPKPKK